MKQPISRRQILTLGALGAVAGSAPIFAQAAGNAARGGAAHHDPIEAELDFLVNETPACVEVPQFATGPYYVDIRKIRRNIREDQPGFPTLIHFIFVDAATCKPLPNVTVNIWHCNFAGEYSAVDNSIVSGTGVNNEGKSPYLRGTQITDQRGSVVFQTVYPGWYPGPPVHVHYTANITATQAFTSQFFLTDDFNDWLYTSFEPYKTRGANQIRIADVANPTPDPNSPFPLMPIPSGIIITPSLGRNMAIIRHVIGVDMTKLDLPACTYKQATTDCHA